jgi:Protein of unknown function (DUF1214)
VTPDVIVEAVRGHRQWYTPFVGGGSAFEHKGERMLDARTLFHYAATGISPAMAAAQPGSGSANIYTARDSNGRYFEGGKTYKVTIPAPVPAALFWSFSIYDNQHRSFLETDQKLAGIDSTFPAMKKNADGRQRCGSGRTRLPGRKATGSRPYLAKVGSPCFGSTARYSLGSTGPGSREISSWCRDSDTSGSSPSILKNSIRRKVPDAGVMSVMWRNMRPADQGCEPPLPREADPGNQPFRRPLHN